MQSTSMISSLSQLCVDNKKKVLLLLLALYITKKYGKVRVSRPHPGLPTHYPFIGALPALAGEGREDMCSFILKVNRATDFQTVDINTPGLKLLMVMDEADRKHVLRTNWTNYKKNVTGCQGNFRDIGGDLFGHGIFVADNEEWKQHRKIASHMFSSNSLKLKMQKVFVENSNLLVTALKKAAAINKQVDIQEMFQAFTFDSICQIAFSETAGALEDWANDQPNQFLLAFDHCQAQHALRFTQIDVMWKLKRSLNILDEKSHKKSLDFVLAYVDAIVQRAKARDIQKTEGSFAEINKEAGMDMLSLYIQFAKNKDKPEVLDSSYLRDVVINFMVAGRDTTSSTLTSLFKNFSANPEAFEHAKSEVWRHIPGSGEQLNLDNLKDCDYLDVCFNETVRMYPPVANDFRISNSRDVLPSGLEIERGTHMIIPNMGIGRDPKNFERPDEFLPERWYKFREGNFVTKIPEYLHPVFFAGLRICLGKDMARYEVKVLTSVLMKNNIKLKVEPTKDAFKSSVVIFYRDPVMASVA